MKSLLNGCIVALVLIAIWQVVVTLTGAPGFILPAPAKVAETLWTSRVLIFENAWITGLEVLAGLVLGTTLGAATALHLSTSPMARRFVMPALVFSQAVPVFALAPVLTLWMGYGIGSKILMTVLIIYFPVTSNFLDGLMNTPKGYLDLARVMNATPARVLWRIRVPSALPNLASGLRLAAVYAPIGAVIGEWVGASRGLGYLMLLANGRAKTDLMFAALVVLASFTVLMHWALGILATRLERRTKGLLP